MTFARRVSLSLLLVALTVFSLGGILDNGFIALDDVAYLTNNSLVKDGLSARGIITAFTSTRQALTWHPLTWVSHMLDVELFGLRPGPHHAVSLTIHTANALLLLFLLNALTGALWRSALVTALFAVHPLHVESVAWAAERKDVLSTFFVFCAAFAYLRAVRRNAVARSAAVPLLFALALMSKAMVVTLPFLFLLLDWWPLNRWIPTARRGAAGLLPPARLWVEKAPLLLLCAVSTATTYIAADSGGAVSSASPIALRLSNASVAYASYLGKTIWPRGLSPFYPYPFAGLPFATVVGAVLLLVIVSVFVTRFASRFPYLAVGWLWFLGTLVPVIGLVQAGMHSMADRYTYVPLIGIFIAATWGLAEILARRRRLALPATALSLALLVALAAVSRAQAALWRDTRSLFTHALQLDEKNFVAWNVLGVSLMEQGRREEAAELFRRSIAINANFAGNNFNLGLALAGLERPQEALPFLQQAVRLRKNDPVGNQLLGLTLFKLGRPEEALGFLLAAVALDPDSAGIRLDLGAVQRDLGKLPAAIAHFRKSLEIEAGNSDIHARLGEALFGSGKTEEAIGELKKAVELDPANAAALNNLGAALAQTGRLEEAESAFRRALTLDGGSVDTRLNLDQVLLDRRRLEEDNARALRRNPRPKGLPPLSGRGPGRGGFP